MVSLRKGVFFLLDISAVITLWKCLGFLIKQYLTKKTTILYDLPNLGRPRQDGERIKGTAIVCGGSFSGLWSARFLSDHFEDVLVVDPETWLATPEGCTPIYDAAGEYIEGSRVNTRTRVSQYRATHAFQCIIFIVLKLLYPSVADDIRKIDGRIGVYDVCAYLFDIKLMRASKTVGGGPVQIFYLTRESVERLLRRLVIQNSPRIRWMSGTVKGFERAKKNNNSLSSVTVRMTDGTERVTPAALVVDCTGPTRAGLRCLQRMIPGTNEPKYGCISLTDPRLRISYYTNQQMRTFYLFVPVHIRAKLPIPGGYDNAKWIYTFTPFLAKGRKSLYVDRVEGHRIRIMVGTWGDLPLPHLDELSEFLNDFDPLQELPKWLFDLVDVLLTLKDSAEIITSKCPIFSKIRYERADCLPSNFVAIGDSVLQANPTFGQGCSKALIGAIVLDSMLRSPSVIDSQEIPAGFSKRFFREQRIKTAITWDGTKPIDYQFTTTSPLEGEELSDDYWSYKYVVTTMLLSKDEQINDVFFRALQFLASPTEFLHPLIVAKVLLHWARQRLGLAPDYLKE